MTLHRLLHGLMFHIFWVHIFTFPISRKMITCSLHNDFYVVFVFPLTKLNGTLCQLHYFVNSHWLYLLKLLMSKVVLPLQYSFTNTIEHEHAKHWINKFFLWLAYENHPRFHDGNLLHYRKLEHGEEIINHWYRKSSWIKMFFAIPPPPR